VLLALGAAGGRALELREKELEGGTGKDAVLLLTNVSDGLLRSWNAENPGTEVVVLDEVVRVDGEEGSASELHAKVKKALDSEAGGELKLDLRRRPYEFLKIHQPGVAMMFSSGPTRALERWTKTWLCENDTLDVGYHTFSCPFVALCAQRSIEGTIKIKDLPPEAKAVIDYGGKVFNKDLGDGNAFLGHFPLSTFDDWSSWTEHEDGFKIVECPDCDHMSIKANKVFKDTVFGTLSDLVKLWSRT